MSAQGFFYEDDNEEDREDLLRLGIAVSLLWPDLQESDRRDILSQAACVELPGSHSVQQMQRIEALLTSRRVAHSNR
jgi:hypothetical protein